MRRAGRASSLSPSRSPLLFVSFSLAVSVLFSLSLSPLLLLTAPCALACSGTPSTRSRPPTAREWCVFVHARSHVRTLRSVEAARAAGRVRVCLTSDIHSPRFVFACALKTHRSFHRLSPQLARDNAPYRACSLPACTHFLSVFRRSAHMLTVVRTCVCVCVSAVFGSRCPGRRKRSTSPRSPTKSGTLSSRYASTEPEHSKEGGAGAGGRGGVGRWGGEGRIWGAVYVDLPAKR